MDIRVLDSFKQNYESGYRNLPMPHTEREAPASDRHEKEYLSPQEIRARVRRGLEKAQRLSQKGAESGADYDANGALKQEVTKEKLKSLLQTNGFSFNPQESKVLQEILSKS